MNEDKLQLSTFLLEQVMQEYSFKISGNKIKTMALRGKYTMRTKTV